MRLTYLTIIYLFTFFVKYSKILIIIYLTKLVLYYIIDDVIISQEPIGLFTNATKDHDYMFAAPFRHAFARPI